MRRLIGAVLVLAALAIPGGALAQPASPLALGSTAWTSNYFSSPSGNIHCREFVDRDLFACITLNTHNAFVVPLQGTAHKESSVSAVQFPHGPTLLYGDRWRDEGRFRCKSLSTGMLCSSLQSGHGFSINRDYYRLF